MKEKEKEYYDFIPKIMDVKTLDKVEKNLLVVKEI